MKNLMRIIKSINIKQVVTVFLAGCLLMVSTACSQSTMAETGGRSDMAKSEMSGTQDFKGGMNGYNDDRRYDAGTAAKAKGLVDTAKSRQKDSLEDYAESITDRAGNKIEQAKRDIPRTLENNKEDAVDYVQNKSDKLQRNLSKIPGGAKDIIDEAGDTAQNAVEDLTKASSQTANEIKGNFEDLS